MLLKECVSSLLQRARVEHTHCSSGCNKYYRSSHPCNRRRSSPCCRGLAWWYWGCSRADLRGTCRPAHSRGGRYLQTGSCHRVSRSAQPGCPSGLRFGRNSKWRWRSSWLMGFQVANENERRSERRERTELTTKRNGTHRRHARGTGCKQWQGCAAAV
jgi:hypothetical protein